MNFVLAHFGLTCWAKFSLKLKVDASDERKEKEEVYECVRYYIAGVLFNTKGKPDRFIDERPA